MKQLLSRIFLTLSSFASAKGDERPVCIVGAGPAGLSAAAQLEVKGYQTVTFEKQSAVGGKCQAIYER